MIYLKKNLFPSKSKEKFQGKPQWKAPSKFPSKVSPKAGPKPKTGPKKPFKKIKYYNLFYSHRKEITKFLNSYELLKRLWNNRFLKKYPWKIVLPYKYKYSFSPENQLGILKIPGWKKNTRDFNFFLDKATSHDRKLYTFWNMNPSPLKQAFSRLNRTHPYRNIYNLAYRTVLFYPYSLIIKPYTLIIKNFNQSNYFIVLEWADQEKKSHLLAKVIFTKAKIREMLSNVIFINSSKKINLKKTDNIFYHLLFLHYKNFQKKFSVKKNYFFSKSYTNPMELVLSKKKIDYLLWRRENWLWRLRAEWKLVPLHKYVYTKKFKNVFLSLLQLDLFERDYYSQLPGEIFVERFTQSFFDELLDFNLKNYTKNQSKPLNVSSSKSLYFQRKDFFAKKFSLKRASFFSRLYYLYFFWLLYYIKNLYIYVNKITFNLWVRFFYFSSKFSPKTFSRFFSIPKRKDFFLNYESFYSQNYLTLVYNFQFQKNFFRYFLNKKNFYKKFFLKKYVSYLMPKNKTSNFFQFFANFISLSNRSLFNYFFKKLRFYKNATSIDGLLNYTETNNYTFYVSFKESYLQTFRSLAPMPGWILFNKKDDNNNRIHWDRIYYSYNLVEKEHWRYTNFELGIHEDKKMYFL